MHKFYQTFFIHFLTDKELDGWKLPWKIWIIGLTWSQSADNIADEGGNPEHAS